MKSNPLFHDSTLSQGANIQTQFELTGVELKSQQTMYLKLIIGKDVRCIEMVKKAEGVYHTSAWIEHRKRISYRFFIQSNGEVVSASDLSSALALHTVSEVWEPLEGSDWMVDFQKIPQVERTELTFNESKEAVSQDEMMDNLIEKWDL